VVPEQVSARDVRERRTGLDEGRLRALAAPGGPISTMFTPAPSRSCCPCPRRGYRARPPVPAPPQRR
jgi:hypothetical protein